jgi:hypothetical protein
MRSLLVLCLLSSSAWAQQPSAAAHEQAMSAKLVTEINAGLACSSELITLKAELESLKAKLKEKEDAQQKSPPG